MWLFPGLLFHSLSLVFVSVFVPVSYWFCYYDSMVTVCWVFRYFQHLSLLKTGQAIQDLQILELSGLFLGDFGDDCVDFVEGYFYVAIFTGLLFPIVV